MGGWYIERGRVTPARTAENRLLIQQMPGGQYEISAYFCIYFSHPHN